MCQMVLPVQLLASSFLERGQNSCLPSWREVLTWQLLNV
jgi:hypothetical protein